MLAQKAGQGQLCGSKGQKAHRVPALKIAVQNASLHEHAAEPNPNPARSESKVIQCCASSLEPHKEELRAE